MSWAIQPYAQFDLQAEVEKWIIKNLDKKEISQWVCINYLREKNICCLSSPPLKGMNVCHLSGAISSTYPMDYLNKIDERLKEIMNLKT